MNLDSGLAAANTAPPLNFVANRLDRATEQREDRNWLEQAWANGGRALIVDLRGQLFVDREHAGLIALTAASGLPGRSADALPDAFLGLLDNSPWFALSAGAAADEFASNHAEGEFIDLRALVAQLDGESAALAAHARALLHWQARKRHCGVCGAITRIDGSGHRAACTHPTCAAQYFPRTDPAIISLVTCGNACLLGRQDGWPPRRWSTLAGFVEPGETLEGAVAREVFEEAGVRIGAVRYVSSQPWPFPASLMLGFEADCSAQPIVCGQELSDARWFDADALLGASTAGEIMLPPIGSISYCLIARFCERVIGQRPPPGPGLLGKR